VHDTTLYKTEVPIDEEEKYALYTVKILLEKLAGIEAK